MINIQLEDVLLLVAVCLPFAILLYLAEWAVTTAEKKGWIK